MKKGLTMLAIMCIAVVFSASLVLAADNVKVTTITQQTEKSPDMKVGTITVENLKTQNFEANEAKIKNLNASLIRAKKIEASLIRAKKIETTELVAARAEIKQLNVEIANIKEANIELARIKQAEIDEANIKLANIKTANIERANIGRMVAANSAKAKECPDGRTDCTQPLFFPAKNQWDYFGPSMDLVDIQNSEKKAGSAASKIQVFPGGKARIQVVRYNGQTSETAFQAAVARAKTELASAVGKYQGRAPGTCRYQLHQ